MELTQEQYDLIADCFPKPRGTMVYSHLEALNAILYIAENGCKWRRLPERFGNWHSLYCRMRRWVGQGVLEKVFLALQQRQIIKIKLEAASLDSSSVKVHPDGTGALKKTVRNPSGGAAEDSPPKFIWLPVMNEPPYASHSLPARQQTARKGESF